MIQLSCSRTCRVLRLPDAIYTARLIHSLVVCLQNDEDIKKEREREQVLHQDLLLTHLFLSPRLLPIINLFSTVPPLSLFLLLLFFSLRRGVLLCRDASVPQFEEAVPGACAHAHAVRGDAGAAHPVVVAGQHT